MRDANYRGGMYLRIIAPAIVSIGLFVVALFGVILPSVESSLLNRKRELIRDLTDLAWGILADFHERELSGELTREEAQRFAGAQLRRLRHGVDATGYYWISDMRSRVVMHPFRPELEATDVSRLTDPDGNSLFASMVALVTEQGAGYVDYMWERKESDDEQSVPKISYVKGFAPWGWIIGTGIFLDDLRAESGAFTRKLTLICASILVIITALSTYMIVNGMRVERRRRQAERDLRWERDFNKSLVDTSAAFFVAIDADGRTLMMNPAMLKALGYTADEVADRPYIETFVPDQWHKAVANTLAEITHRNDRVVCENEVRAKDGRTLLVEWHGKRVPGQSGRRDYLFNVGIDITERRRAEADRGRLLEQLHQSQKMEAIGQLAGGVAHDFNNLLTIIFAGVDVIRERVADDAQASEALRGINDAASEAASVARSLLTFGREISFEKKPVNLCALVEESTRLHRRILPSNIEMKVDTSCEPAPWVDADPTKLQQILFNLTLNARDAMPGGGTIRVTVSPDAEPVDDGGAMVALTVSDTGTGIPENVRDRIFEPFFTTKPRGEGTGLGLSVVHGLVTEHGGMIDVFSEAGRGTTVTVRLPRRDTGAGHHAGEAADAAPRGRGELILVAEDNAYIRQVIASTLRSRDYAVVEVTDGPAILETVTRLGEQVRLLLLDVDLPGRGGLACLHDMRAHGASMPAIVMTGGSLDGQEDELDENTVLLRKPFQMSDLGRLIVAMLDMPEVGEADLI